MLQDVQRNAHEWGVGGSKDVARLEICHSNEEKDLSSGGDKLFLNCGMVRLG